MENKVSVVKCENYREDNIIGAVNSALSLIGVGEDTIRGKKVVIKPNLLLAYQPEKAATTHPAVLYAVCEYIKKLSPASVIIAESPGGMMNEKTLKRVYTVTGTLEAAEKSGTVLNYSVDTSTLSLPDGDTAKSVPCLDVIKDADVIINVCKAKTHSLAGITGASKNLFGIIPGITKFEMHARFKNPGDFFGMICDMDARLCQTKTVVSICDGVVGMEGNGPSGGTPKALGTVLASLNPFALDTVLCHLMEHDGRVKLLSIAKKRGYVGDFSSVEVIGDEITSVKFLPADGALATKFSLIPKFLQPRPYINPKKCRGCFTCVESCPQKTIKISGRVAKIVTKNCIRCYCCQELCTFKAVDVKKNFIYGIIK